jgi:hypothetical protein
MNRYDMNNVSTEAISSGDDAILLVALLLLHDSLDLDNLGRRRCRLVREELGNLESCGECVVEHHALLERRDKRQEHGDEQDRTKDDPADRTVVAAGKHAHDNVATVQREDAHLHVVSHT